MTMSKARTVLGIIIAIVVFAMIVMENLPQDSRLHLPDPNVNCRVNSKTTTVVKDATALVNKDCITIDDQAAAKMPYPYNPKDFDTRWRDKNDADMGLGGLSRNGCDTRNDILNRDLTHIRYIRPGNRCEVLTGTLPNDPYTGRAYPFTYAGPKAEQIDIEHIVARKNAWQSGAWKWTHERRIDFTNDPLHLIAVHHSENQSKGDRDASQWLVPNNPAYRCEYAGRQVLTKVKYDLSMTHAEHKALQDTLNMCSPETGKQKTKPFWQFGH